MAALDFPLAPTLGQTYPNPAVAGLPVYRWDGSDWLSAYPLGPLILPGDPTDPLGAATKQYVDNTLAYSGMQVNGSMEVSQEIGGVTTIPAGTQSKSHRWVEDR